MHDSWQSWGRSLVFNTASDYFFLATILINTELDVFAEQPGVFFGVCAVVCVAGLSSCPTDTPTGVLSSSFPVGLLGNAEVKTNAIH